MSAIDIPDDEQIGEISAGGQENEDDEPHQREQRRAVLFAKIRRALAPRPY